MKTNSESSAAENETANAATNELDVQGMSSGAAMLIERMRTNPDDFKYGGRFYLVVQGLESDQSWISARDKRALNPAYELHIQEAEFTEWVYGVIFAPKVEQPEQKAYAGSLLTPAMITQQALGVLENSLTDSYRYNTAGRYNVGSS